MSANVAAFCDLTGTRRGELNPPDSGFSQWLAAGNSNCKEDNYAANAVDSADNDLSLAASQSPIGTHRDNTPSSLQRPDKHSQHSSLQNIQGDLNDILDRLQNMVANDCLLDGRLSLVAESEDVRKRLCVRGRLLSSRNDRLTVKLPRRMFAWYTGRTFLMDTLLLIAESYDGSDNGKLKRATTEMEDLLTGLIEGMESRKSKLTTIV